MFWLDFTGRIAVKLAFKLALKFVGGLAVKFAEARFVAACAEGGYGRFVPDS